MVVHQREWMVLRRGLLGLDAVTTLLPRSTPVLVLSASQNQKIKEKTWFSSSSSTVTFDQSCWLAGGHNLDSFSFRAAHEADLPQDTGSFGQAGQHDWRLQKGNCPYLTAQLLHHMDAQTYGSTCGACIPLTAVIQAQ